MGITVTPFDVTDEAAVARAYRIVAAAVAADLPDFPPEHHGPFAAALHHPNPGNRKHWALAYLDGIPAGYVNLTLPQLDNLDNALVELTVHPEHRRRGVGRALHEHTLRVLRDENRKRLVGETVRQLPDGPARSGAGAAFAEAMGAAPVLFDVRRRLDVTGLDRAALDRMLADAWSRAAGYSLVRWRDAAPEEYVADVAYLDSRLIGDAPMGDLAWEPEKVDVVRVRAGEETMRARGRRRYHTGVRHEASGHLVAWSMLDFGPANRWHADQQITIVEPRHRGHRLGLIVKIENLRYALAYEPQLRVIDTWNAAANDHMIAINEAMGFRPVDGWDNWQLSR